MNLDELERLEREATAGPWSSTPSDPSQGYECFWITACPEINQEREIATVCGPQNERNTSNAALIAALRNSARELIADARRFRWLTEDHSNIETRFKCRELLSRMGVMSYSAACASIDAAIAQEAERVAASA